MALPSPEFWPTGTRVQRIVQDLSLRGGQPHALYGTVLEVRRIKGYALDHHVHTVQWDNGPTAGGYLTCGLTAML